MKHSTIGIHKYVSLQLCWKNITACSDLTFKGRLYRRTVAAFANAQYFASESLVDGMESKQHCSTGL